MLEVLSIIISLILSVYGLRSLIFLCKARGHHNALNRRHLHGILTSTLKISHDGKCIDDTINYLNIAPSGIFRGKFLGETQLEEKVQLNTNEFRKNFDTQSIRTWEYLENSYFPTVSLIVATNNEESVIERLLESIEKLTYDRNRFEVIVVDDSTDSTARILQRWKKRMHNLKVLSRTERIGSKGQALNLALEKLSHESSWVIIVDADMVLLPNTIEQFLEILHNSSRKCVAIQGYCLPYNNHLYENNSSTNWVSKGTEFRLALRNMIEFVARDKFHLPVQITGSLFMINRSVLQEIGFSTDLCEDWDLTLQLYLKQNDICYEQVNKNSNNMTTTSILFDENLNGLSQSPTSFSSYFKQRLRVSEGHTRGFIKRLPILVKQINPINTKIEIFLTGFHYLKYILILPLMLLDGATIISLSSEIYDGLSIASISIQLFCLSAFIIANIGGMVICNTSRRHKRYNTVFLLSKLLLDICVAPALIFGSLRGILRNKGSFYRTQRIASCITPNENGNMTL